MSPRTGDGGLSFPRGGLIPREGTDALIVLGRAIGILSAGSGSATAQKEHETKPCHDPSHVFHIFLIDDLIPDFNGLGRGSWHQVGHRGGGIHGDHLHFTDHLFTAVDDHAEPLNNLIVLP